MSRLVLAAYAFAILSIGLTADSRLRHEDNGAMHTTLALSHLALGLDGTRAHDVFVNRVTGERRPYGHHPPALPLVLAAVFALTGSDSPAVARLTVMAFQIGSVLLVVAVLGELVGNRAAWLGGLFMATLPMSGYFGRMVNYEPLCLFAVMVQLLGYVRWKIHGRRRDAWLLGVGVVWGGVVDWPAFFFAAALASVEVIDLARRKTSGAPLALLIATATGVFAFDLWHLWYAARGSMQAFGGVLASNEPLWAMDASLSRFVLGQVDTFRRYFTEAGLISTGLALWSLAAGTSGRPHDDALSPLTRRVLAATFGAAFAYVVTAPAWAMMHQYWQFYFLPSVVISMVLAWLRLEHAMRTRPGALFRAMQVAFVLDVLMASGYWLHFRHTRPESYAIETTASFRALYLTPKSVPDDAPSPGGSQSLP